MTLDPKSLALASGATATILWIFCSALVFILPGMMMGMTGDMMHADMSQMSWTLNIFGFLIGLILWAVLAMATGWLIATFYNRFSLDETKQNPQ